MSNICFKKYKDVHIADRCFIICNGPSLSQTNLDLIKNEITFAMNRISLIYDKTEWRPTYYLYASTNVNHIDWGDAWTDSVRKSIKSSGVTSFIAEKFKNRIDPKNKYTMVNWINTLSENKPTPEGLIRPECFSRNICERIDKSGSTVNIALQIAFHMGFKEIIFLGADLGFTNDTGSHSDPNHFDASYRANIPNALKANLQMRNVHSLAASVFKNKTNIKMYNASIKTTLDIYPIINFEEYMNGNLIMRNNDFEKAKQFWSVEPQYGRSI